MDSRRCYWGTVCSTNGSFDSLLRRLPEGSMSTGVTNRRQGLPEVASWMLGFAEGKLLIGRLSTKVWPSQTQPVALAWRMRKMGRGGGWLMTGSATTPTFLPGVLSPRYSRTGAGASGLGEPESK